MARVVLLRGVNVGGHKTFRPSILARELSDYDVVNIGAAGTFVIRKPVSQKTLRSELIRKLPFDAELIICDGNDFAKLVSTDPFAGEASGPDIVRFVSVLSKSKHSSPSMPLRLPSEGDWLLKIIAAEREFLFGVHRRQMKAIGYLNQIEKIFGVPATTRNWNTINAIARVLKSEEC